MNQRVATRIDEPRSHELHSTRAKRPSRKVRRRRRSRLRRVILLCILLVALFVALITPFGSTDAHALVIGGATAVGELTSA